MNVSFLFRGFVSEIGLSLVERLLWAWCGKKCPADSFFKPSIAAVRPQAAERRGRGRYCRLDRSELERAKKRTLTSQTRCRRQLAPREIIVNVSFLFRDLAQPGRALALGARCRWFESNSPDQFRRLLQNRRFFVVRYAVFLWAAWRVEGG